MEGFLRKRLKAFFLKKNPKACPSGGWKFSPLKVLRVPADSRDNFDGQLRPGIDLLDE